MNNPTEVDSQLAQDFQQACSADDARDNPMIRRTITIATAEKLGEHWANDYKANPKIRRNWRRESAKANKFLWKFYPNSSWKQ